MHPPMRRVQDLGVASRDRGRDADNGSPDLCDATHGCRGRHRGGDADRVRDRRRHRPRTDEARLAETRNFTPREVEGLTESGTATVELADVGTLVTTSGAVTVLGLGYDNDDA